LIETLAALAVAGAIFAIVAEFAGRALRSWNRGEATIAVMEMVTRGFGRMATDLSLAVPMTPPGTDGSTVFFVGEPNRLIFVAATGFGTGDRGLELLNITAVTERDDFTLVRQRGPVANPAPQLRDPVVLLRGRMQIRFSYRDQNGQTLAGWSNRRELPAAVLVELFGPTRVPVFPVPLLFPVSVNQSVDCLYETESGADKPPRCTTPTNEPKPETPAPQQQNRR
jgi:hypothetical protein